MLEDPREGKMIKEMEGKTKSTLSLKSWDS